MALLVVAKTIVVAPDLVLSNGRILLRGGKVAAVGEAVPAELGSDVHRIDLGDAVIVPGFVVPHAYLGAERDLAETADAFTPDLRAIEAYDPFAKNVARMLAGGVTTAAIAPRSANTFAGLAGAAKTGPEGGSVLQEQCYLKLALVPESLDQQRFPTSRMGALDLVRAAFRAAADPLAAVTPEKQTLRDVLSGAVPLLAHARTHDEITCALDLLDAQRGGVLAGAQVRVLLFGATQAHQSMARLVAQRAGVIVEPGQRGNDDEGLRLPVLLARNQVRFGFAANSPQELRLAAALAVRHGLPRTDALAALTAWPAELLGLHDRVGSLRQGRDADLLAFDGDPIDLTSRLLAVCVAGQLVAANPRLPAPRPLAAHTPESGKEQQN
jgi:imidazolonepropionase-like amidohydrolase